MSETHDSFKGDLTNIKKQCVAYQCAVDRNINGWEKYDTFFKWHLSPLSIIAIPPPPPPPLPQQVFTLGKKYGWIK